MNPENPNPSADATAAEGRPSWLSPRAEGSAARLALGTMNFGGRTDEAEATRIVRRALERGVSCFDTANVYGDGASERILGRALGADRPRCLVATKVGLLRRSGRPEGLAPAVVRASVEASLERLGTEWIDLCYFHAPDLSTPIEASMEAMASLVAEGKVRSFGVSNFASWQVLEMIHLADERGWPRPSISQVLYNPLVRQIEIEHLPFTRRYGVHVTVYNVLAGGLLTGKHARGAITKGSRFDRNRMYQRRYLTDRMFELVDALSAVAKEVGRTPTELAYAWGAAQPGVDSILLGPASPSHLDAALDACARPLPSEARARIDELYTAYLGTDARYARLSG